MIARLGAKGQIVIPKEIRELLGVEAGSSVSLRMRPDGVVEMSRAWTDPIAEAPAYVRAAMPVATSDRSAVELLHELDREDMEIDEGQHQRWLGKRSS
jgi:AbrB family looped-hinge helix DNA binding protein